LRRGTAEATEKVRRCFFPLGSGVVGVGAYRFDIVGGGRNGCAGVFHRRCLLFRGMLSSLWDILGRALEDTVCRLGVAGI
jgi:hypothetical protein